MYIPTYLKLTMAQGIMSHNAPALQSCIRFVLGVFNTHPNLNRLYMAAFDSTQHPCAGPSELGGAGGGGAIAPPKF